MNFKIAKKCYEKRFINQKYEESILHGTYGNVVGDIIQETKRLIFEDIKKYKVRTGCILINDKAFDVLKQKHLYLIPLSHIKSTRNKK